MNDWSEDYQPTTAEEFFNMKHSSTRNVIERCFGILKKRWAILRSAYPIKTQTKIIMACCFLHKFIRREMHIYPFEDDDEDMTTTTNTTSNEPITSIGITPEWTAFRTNLAQSMFHTRI